MKSILLLTSYVFLFSSKSLAQENKAPLEGVLPGTEKLVLSRDLHAVMVRGISQFAERELLASPELRTAPWLTAPDREVTTTAARQRLRESLGAVDTLETKSPLFHSAFSWSDSLIGGPQGKLFSQSIIQHHVAEGITSEVLMLHSLGNTDFGVPKRQSNPIVVLLCDPAESPYALAGMMGEAEDRTVLRLVESGFDVYCPILIDRRTEYSGHPDIKQTNLTHREYVYRLGFELGRHIIGYEVERVLALVTRLKQDPARPIILVGTGEGAVIAQYAAALHPELFAAVVLHGYFGPRENVWQEPIYRNVWGQLTEFGDAEIASLIAPTPLIIEAGQAPTVTGPPEPLTGQAKIAAPGTVTSPPLGAVEQEFNGAKEYYQTIGADQIHLVKTPASVCGPETIEILNRSLGLQLKPLEKTQLTASSLSEEVILRQQKRLLDELVRHTQMLLTRADKVRAKLWKLEDRLNPAVWEKKSAEYRELVHDSFIGKFPPSTAPLRPRSRQVIDEPTHVGYEIVLDVFPSATGADTEAGVIAGGILLLPKDLKAGERRPVVVCQHGLEGTPLDTLIVDKSVRAYAAYKGFGTELAQRGFIVYAPQNPYKGFDDFREIQRKSNPLGRSLFSYIIEQHRQTLIWLSSLDSVDPQRIAFYGLSYGGKTAVRVPPLLPLTQDVPGYCLSICSADFNEWIRKNVSAEDRYSYVYTPEYEIFEWNMGHIANYAELSWLMFPRPFMVERGHDDGVAPDEWVGWEFAKVRRHYTKLGQGDKAEIEWFDGPHTINGKGTYKFLHRHLNWPEPK